MPTAEFLLQVYDRLFRTYGSQHWWPGEGGFEVMVGAILTQATAWANVEKALAHLKRAGALSPATLRSIPQTELAQLVHPCVYYNAKAAKLKALASWLGQFGDDLEKAFAGDTVELRKQLLGVYGIGEETADSILLYVAGRPTFVVDAYTRRIFERLGLNPTPNSYHAWQRLFTEHLPLAPALFNEYHALLVVHGKQTCHRQPRCGACCLQNLCPYGKQNPHPLAPSPLRERGESN